MWLQVHGAAAGAGRAAGARDPKRARQQGVCDRREAAGLGAPAHRARPDQQRHQPGAARAGAAHHAARAQPGGQHVPNSPSRDPGQGHGLRAQLPARPHPGRLSDRAGHAEHAGRHGARGRDAPRSTATEHLHFADRLLAASSPPEPS